jgi:hypothetical protein
MPDFVARLAQRGAGLHAGAAPQPTAAPWAAAPCGGPADITIGPESGAARDSELPAPAPPRRAMPEDGALPTAPARTSELAVLAAAARSPEPASILPRDHSSALPAARLAEALSPPPKPRIEEAIVAKQPRPPAQVVAAPLRGDPTPAPPPLAVKAGPALRSLDTDAVPAETPAPPSSAVKAGPALRSLDTDAAPAETPAVAFRTAAKANPPPGDPPANTAPQPPRTANPTASAPPGNRSAPSAAVARPVSVLALPQSTRPATSPMTDAAAPEQRPIQVRISRVEVRASQPAAMSGPRPARAVRQGFGAMQMARSWLGRSFY